MMMMMMSYLPVKGWRNSGDLGNSNHFYIPTVTLNPVPHMVDRTCMNSSFKESTKYICCQQKCITYFEQTSPRDQTAKCGEDVQYSSAGCQ